VRWAVAIGVLAFLAILAATTVPTGDPPVPSPEPGPGAPPPSDDPEVPGEPPGALPAAEPSIRVITNVPGCEVTLLVRTRGPEPDPPPIVGTADAEGVARFPARPGAEPVEWVRATARAPGYAPASESVRDGVARIELEPGVPLSGIVRSAGGRPLARARIHLHGRAAYADADGRFVVHAKKAGAVELRVTHPAHVAGRFPATAPATGLLLTLDPGLTVSGAVRFPDGKPVPGVSLQASGVSLRTTTDEDGRYVLSGFEPGEAKLVCVPTWEKRAVEAGARGVDFTVDRHLFRIVVLDGEGRPFRNASIVWRKTRGQDEDAGSGAGSVDSEGRITIAAWPGERVLVSPSAPGHAQEEHLLLAEGTPRLHDVKLVLRPPAKPGRVEVRVRRADGEVPASVFLRLENATGFSVRGFSDRKIDLDEKGRATVEGVPPGRFTARLSESKRFSPVEGYGLPAGAAVTVESGVGTPLEAVLPEGGRIRVTVRSPAGEVLVPARLVVRDPEGGRVRAAFYQRTGDEIAKTTADLERLLAILART